MNNRYRTALALTSLLLLAAAPAHHQRRHAAAPSIDLYSARALRRARTILQLKLLEIRKARLERVRRALERGLPVDQIVRP